MIETTTNNEFPNKYHYPRLKYFRSNPGLVVLFVTDKKGMVLRTNERAGHFVGKIEDDWQTNLFEDFDEPLTLRNM
jgi:hypothetical protein